MLALLRFLPSVPFVVAIRCGRVKAYARKPLPRGFILTIEDLVDGGRLVGGVVYGARQQGGLTIKFAPGFPVNVRQQLLNSWHVHKQQYSG